MQNFALGLVELPQERTGPSLKPVKVPGEFSLQRVVDKLAEGALNLTAHVANKDVSASPNTDEQHSLYCDHP